MFGLAIVGDIVPTLASAQYRHNGDQKYLLEQMLTISLHPRITLARKILQGTVHLSMEINQRPYCI